MLPKKKPSPKPFQWWLILIFATISTTLMTYKGVDFVVEDEDGNLKLSEERQQKLNNKLKELEEAEQYALVAIVPGYYPCYSCPNSDSIYLQMMEVWRYGVTTKSKHGRYADKYLNDNRLLFVTQMIGTLQECLREEQLKIYNYALLPENLKRLIILIRPPGNKVDN